jgi:dephospho-CoA kinase
MSKEVMKMADYKIDNSGTAQELHQKLEDILSKINQK